MKLLSTKIYQNYLHKKYSFVFFPFKVINKENIKMIKRPDRSETEEDLLRLQQEYLAKKQKPSVSLKLSNDPKDIKGKVILLTYTSMLIVKN